MINLPNPFDSALDPATGADDGHWPATADPADPVAVTFAEPPTLTGRCQEAPTDSPVGSRVDVGAFDNRFVLDEAKFMEAIEAPPAFLASPGLPYLAIVEVLAGR